MTDTYVVNATTGKASIIKDPTATLDYIFDWTLWLDDVVDTIASHIMTIPAGLTLVNSTKVGKTVVAFISGGAVGQTYQVDCQITTNSSPARIDSRSIYIKIKDR